LDYNESLPSTSLAVRMGIIAACIKA